MKLQMTHPDLLYQHKPRELREYVAGHLCGHDDQAGVVENNEYKLEHIAQAFARLIQVLAANKVITATEVLTVMGEHEGHPSRSKWTAEFV